MRIGVCANPQDWVTVAEKGYDYIETNFASIANSSDEDFAFMLAQKEKAGLDVEACMGYFPGTFKLYAYDETTGEASPAFAEIEKQVYEHSEKGFSKASKLGIKIAVIGSGAARNIPDNMKHEVAEAQFTRVLEICAEVAQKYGARIVIEPLKAGETNYINTLADGLALCRKINNPAICVLNDFYHSALGGETPDALFDSGDLLIHTHISKLNRHCPNLEEDGEILLPMVQNLVNAGYNDRMSLECMFSPDVPTALENARTIVDAFKAIKAQ